MEEIYQFLTLLSENNNREWFNANKNMYLSAQERFNLFAKELIERISQWDKDIANSRLTLKDCTYRIYRDTRFSKNKDPYKTHFGVYICKGGKKSPYAGYYFHIEPTIPHTPDFTYQRPLSLGGSLLAAGLYCFEPKALKSIRDEISVNGDDLLDAIFIADGFILDTSEKLKRVPPQFSSAPLKWHELLKHRNFTISKPVSHDELMCENLAEKVSEKLKKCKEYIRLLNLAIDYSLESDTAFF